MLLAPEQLAAFKRDGVLTLPGFVPESQLDTWRDTFWRAIGAAPDDAETWPGECDRFDPGSQASQRGIPGLRLSDFAPMVAIADQLMGAGVWRRGLRPPNPEFGETEIDKEDDLLQCKWPDPERAKQWQRPNGGHVDGGNTHKGGWKGGFMLGAITCLEDTAPGGGNFFYWPRSHLAVHSFLKANPKFINPNQFKHPFSDTKSLDRVAPSGYNEQPVEWIAKAGDLILWHHWTMHIGSMNVNSSPRLGLFARYHHRDWFQMRMDKGGIRSDGDLWKYWSPEVRQVRESYGALSKL